MQQSGRLLYDRPHPGDFQRFYQIHSDPQTNLFNPNGPMDLENAKGTFNEWLSCWDEYRFGSWSVKLKESGIIIGFGGLSYRMYGNELKMNLGYRFDKAYWGNGYATELTNYAINYGFNELLIEKIFAVVRPKHTASIRVLEKCGMQLYGTLDDVPDQEQSLIYISEKK